MTSHIILGLASDDSFLLAVTLLLQSSVLLALGLGCGWAMRRRRASLRCLIARATVGAVVLSMGSAVLTRDRPALWSVPVGSSGERVDSAPRVWASPQVLARPVAPPEAMVMEGPALESRETLPARRVEPPVAQPAASRGSAGVAAIEERGVVNPAPAPSARLVERSPEGERTQAREPIKARESGVASVVRVGVLLWAAGALLNVCWLLIGWAQVALLRRRATAVAEESRVWMPQVLGSGLAVLESEGASGPFLCGLWRPTVIVPRGFTQAMEAPALRAVLAHEAAHAVRRDLWWSIGARLACAMLWPQPLIWVLARRLEAAQEEACDQAVLSAGCAPGQYAECLVRLAEARQIGPLQRAASVGAAPTRSALSRRVRHILSGAGDAPPSMRARAGVAAGVAAGVVLSLGLAPGQPQRSGRSQVLAGAPVSSEVSEDEIVGIVRDPSGRAVGGAHVVINEDISSNTMLLARADASGRFRFQVPANRAGNQAMGDSDSERFTCWATAYAPGWAATAMEGHLEAGRLGEIRLEREVRVCGVVRDRSGRGVANVPVRLSRAGEHIPFTGGVRGVWVPEILAPALTVRTDARGRYEVRGVPALGTAQLEISDPRFVRREFAVTLSGAVSDAPTQVLRRASFVTGRVLGTDGRPRAGIEMWASSLGGSIPKGEAGSSRGLTNRDGIYRLGSLPPARVKVMAKDRSGASVARALESVVLGPNAVVRAPDIQLQRGGTISGRVVDRDSGEPIGGALVSSNGGGIFPSVASDAQGRYSLRLPAGNGSIYLSAVPRGYLYPTLSRNSSSLGVRLAEGAGQTFTVRLRKGLSASGTALTTDGKPAAKAVLMAQRIAPRYQHSGFGSQKFARVEGDGAWKLEALTAGRYKLSVLGGWQVVEPREMAVRVAPGSAPLRVTLRAVREPRISGRVLASGGRPIAGARVRISVGVPYGNMSYVHFPVERLSDSAGRWSLSTLRADAKVSIEATKSGYKYLSGGQVTKRQSDAGTVFSVRDIILTRGQSAKGARNGPDSLFAAPRPSDKPRAITPAHRAQLASGLRSSASIRGRVVYEDGRPVRTTVELSAEGRAAQQIRAQLDWRSEEGKHLLRRLKVQVKTQVDGTFEARGLAPFTWSVKATNVPRGFVARRPRDISLRRGARARAGDIVLVRGGVLRVRMADAPTAQLLRAGLPISYSSQPRFNNVMESLSAAAPNAQGILFITVPPGVVSIGMWRSSDGQNFIRSTPAQAISTGDLRTYDLRSNAIEVSLDNGPRQKKRDGRLSIPIEKGQTRDLTFFLQRQSG